MISRKLHLRLCFSHRLPPACPSVRRSVFLCGKPPPNPQATRTVQKRAKEVYTKHFDAQSLAFYWHNSQIDTYLWEKPAGLGSWDVDPEDRVR